MPAFASILNSLLRLYPAKRLSGIYQTAERLELPGQRLVDPERVDAELLQLARAWHTRKAIELCRGWNWPYWLQRQLDPTSPSYMSPSLAPTYLNSHHRDAVCVPGLGAEFVGSLDPRGMLTPRNGQFSIEVWLLHKGQLLRMADAEEKQIRCSLAASGAQIELDLPAGTLKLSASAERMETLAYTRLTATFIPSADDSGEARLVFAIRPYDLHGTLPLHDLVYNSRGFWMSDSRIIAWSPQKPAQSWASDYAHGDSAFFFEHPPERTAVRCSAGMASGISIIEPGSNDAGGPLTADLIVPAEPAVSRTFPFAEFLGRRKYARAAAGAAGNESPTAPLLQQLLSATDFTSAALREEFPLSRPWLAATVSALHKQGEADAVERLLRYGFLSLQKNGYLQASGGSWLLHGEVLAAMGWYYARQATGWNEQLVAYSNVRTVARWIMRKRREVAHSPGKPKGLLPPGLTRSGHGTAYNLADNLWALEGLAAAATLARMAGEHHDADVFRKDSQAYAARISAAIHREIEFGFSQLVPGRLFDTYEPETAAEILDLVILPEARTLLKTTDWFDKLLTDLSRETGKVHPGLAVRNVDKNGLQPARRLLLAQALRESDPALARQIIDETQKLQTTWGVWSDRCAMPGPRQCGNSFISLEATALSLLLA